MVKLLAAHTLNLIVLRVKFGLTGYKELLLALLYELGSHYTCQNNKSWANLIVVIQPIMS